MTQKSVRSLSMKQARVKPGSEAEIQRSQRSGEEEQRIKKIVQKHTQVYHTGNSPLSEIKNLEEQDTG